jgi:hypothetical protein
MPSAIPHYSYLLKMPGTNSVLSLKGDLKHSYDCDIKTVQLAANEELQGLMDHDPKSSHRANYQDKRCGTRWRWFQGKKIGLDGFRKIYLYNRIRILQL